MWHKAKITLSLLNVQREWLTNKSSICGVIRGSPLSLNNLQRKPIAPASIRATPKETDLSPALTRE
jgi:hypothetical protein